MAGERARLKELQSKIQQLQARLAEAEKARRESEERYRMLVAMEGIGAHVVHDAEGERVASAFHERNRQFEAFFENAITPLVFLDPQFNFIRVNAAYACVCGRPVSSFPGHNHFEFYPNAENEAIFAQVVRTRTPYQAVAKPFEFADHPERGVTYWDWTLVPVLNDAGAVEFLVYSLLDVTNRVRAEEQLRRAERLTALGRFAAGVAHEVNNPLTSILLTASVAARRAKKISDLRAALREIIADAERCAQLIKNVLAFTRREPGERVWVSVNEVVQNGQKLAQPAAFERGVQMRLELTSGLPAVLGNRMELEQALLHLISNAIAASAAGQEVEIRTDQAGDRVRIRVIDHGCGMSSAETDHAFEPFFTTRTGDGAAGLGLSMVHGIIEAHGGTVTLESKPGEGTGALVLLPAAPRDSEPLDQ